MLSATKHPAVVWRPFAALRVTAYSENWVMPLMDTLAPCTVLARPPSTVAPMFPFNVAWVPASRFSITRHRTGARKNW